VRKYSTLLLFLSAMIFFFTEPICAAQLPEEYRNFYESIPYDVSEMLPEGIFSEDVGEVSDSLTDALSVKSLLGLVHDLLVGSVPDAFSLFCTLVCLMIVSVLMNALSETFAGAGMRSAAVYASSLCSSVIVAAMQFPRITAAGGFFQRICIMMNSMIPVMTALYIAGGNTAAAAINASSLLIQLNLIELCATSLVLPAVCACMALTLADSFRTGEGSLSGIVGSIKHTLAFVFGLCGTLLMASLASQHIIAAAGDNAGARAVKFLAGNMIPVVGSTVGDTLRTLAASVKLLRSTVGIAGILTLGLLLLPFLIELLLTRLALNSAAAFGEMLGCKSLVKLSREIASLYGYLIAAAAMASVLCVLSLTLFAVGSTAIGGLG
jgi:stage III sporulation protein AE